MSWKWRPFTKLPWAFREARSTEVAGRISIVSRDNKRTQRNLTWQAKLKKKKIAGQSSRKENYWHRGGHKHICIGKSRSSNFTDHRQCHSIICPAGTGHVGTRLEQRTHKLHINGLYNCLEDLECIRETEGSRKFPNENSIFHLLKSLNKEAMRLGWL